MPSEYELFDEIVSAGSLSKAARRMGVSNAVVSKRLRQLEGRLGVTLIHRTTRRLALTDEGRRFHERIAEAVATIRDAEAAVSSSGSGFAGKLRVSAPTSFGRLHIAPLIVDFVEANPRIELELELTDTYVNLLAGRFDVAIRICSAPDPGLAAARLAKNNRLLCAAPEYIARHGRPQALPALSRHRLLAAHGQLPWRLEGPGGAATVSGRSFVRTNSSEVIRELALSGAGIALRSDWDVGDALRDGKLVRVLDEYSGSSDVAIYAVYPRTEFVPYAVRRLVEFLSDRFLPNPPWESSDGGSGALLDPEIVRNFQTP